MTAPKITPRESGTARTLGLNGKGESSPSTEEPFVYSALGVDRTGGNLSTSQPLKDAINHLLDGFAPSELYAVLFVARRLHMGRKKYGVLNPLDGRDWDVMAAEELADKLVYSAAQEMKAEVYSAAS